MADEKPPQPENAPGPLQGAQGIPPAPDAPPPPTGPKMVTVKYLGREYQMDEDAAKAWTDREQAMSRQGQELGELRRTRQPEPPRQEPKEPDLETLWFENPRAAAERLRRETIEEIRGEYRRDQALKAFHDGFYAKHSDLREDEDVVRMVFEQNIAELGDLPVSRAQDRLGELVRERLVKLIRKAPTNGNTPRPRTLAEPASGERPAPRPPAPDEGPKSIGEVLQARSRARREAQVGARRGT